MLKFLARGIFLRIECPMLSIRIFEMTSSSFDPKRSDTVPLGVLSRVACLLLCFGIAAVDTPTQLYRLAAGIQ